MDLEAVALEAVKVKIQEIFDGISVSTEMNGKDIVIRINLPLKQPIKIYARGEDMPAAIAVMTAHLDQEAQSAANELLGTDAQAQA